MTNTERLADGFHQITEEFNTWVNGDFKQLATKVHDLVIDTDVLVKQTEACAKLSYDLVVLSAVEVLYMKEKYNKVWDGRWVSQIE